MTVGTAGETAATSDIPAAVRAGERRTALVLGGGGPIGIAWEAGLVLGLRDRGIDLARVDRIVGTSAGSIVGAHLATLGSVDELYAAQATPLGSTMRPPNVAPFMAALMKAKIFARSVEKQRKSIGKSARSAKVEGEPEWLAAIASFLPGHGTGQQEWPERELLVTAIDAETGELLTWTRERGVPLPVAVASSCAVPCVYPLVHIGGGAYMDGGMGSPINAEFATGYDLVIIADPLARLLGRESTLETEREMLEVSGSEVVVFKFDEATDALVGMNLMDASKRGEVARLGREQGRLAAGTMPALAVFQAQ